MKTLYTVLSATILLSATIEAGQKNCSQSACCNPCSTTQWYKAKDGTYREMLPYAKALSRAEDADDMEPVLKKAQADLTAANEQIAAIRSESEKIKAELEAQVAELRQQLDAEKQSVAALKDRVNKAEEAHKLCIEQVAQLKDDGKKKEEVLATAKADLTKVSEERDSLKAATADLEKQVSALTDAKNGLEEKLKAAQAELEKVKQEAAESKKAQVEEEKAEKKDETPKDAPAGDKQGETPADALK